MIKFEKIAAFLLIAIVFIICLCPDAAWASKACDVSKFQAQYTKECFSCATVSTIVSAFLDAGATAYEKVMVGAANTVLGVLSMLWIAMFLLKKLSSFSAVELPEFMQELGKFFFKIVIAAICINGGASIILDYTLNPIISFGTDLGIAFLSLTADVPTSSSSAEDYLNIINQINNMEVFNA